jgi:hypothetical protein
MTDTAVEHDGTLYRDFLTEPEMRVIEMAGSIQTIFAKEIVGHGDSRAGDLREICNFVHGIQNAALAQAAARLYPHLYRTMGDTK